jgi:3,4-dihydroxy 2-butanone 4-phosphate synthase / GTP cyclohydrolase II
MNDGIDSWTVPSRKQESSARLVSKPQEIAQALARGEIVIVVDDEDRENEGDFVQAAEFVTADSVNFMAKFGRGLICLTLSESRCDRLGLELAEKRHTGGRATNFTASIDAVHGTTTGISAADRARTIQVAIDPDSRPQDLMQPGHVFPLMARPGGVLERPGHTEAGCDYAALAGLKPAAVICEIMNDDGSMARLPELIEVAARHGLRIGTIADLVHYRRMQQGLLTGTFDEVGRVACTHA